MSELPKLSNLEILSLMCLKDSRPDCFLRRTKNNGDTPVYKLMDGDFRPLTYFLCSVIDGLKGKKLIDLVKRDHADYSFNLSLEIWPKLYTHASGFTQPLKTKPRKSIETLETSNDSTNSQPKEVSSIITSMRKAKRAKGPL
jgi:hypothetical protein